MNEIKLCKNCKWAIPEIKIVGFWKPKSVESYKYAKCKKTEKESPRALVTGEPELEYESCSAQRCTELEDTCGTRGKWFEPKEAA